MSDFSQINSFRQESLTGVVRKFPRPTNLLGLNMLPEKKVDGNVAKWDIVEGPRKIGSFVAVGAPAVQVAGLKKTPETAMMMRVPLEQFLDAGDLLYARAPGTIDTAYIDYINGKLVEELGTLGQYIDTTKEYAAWQALVAGSITVSQSNGVIFTANTGYAASHLNVVPAVLWTTTATADPGKDFTAWTNTIEQDAGISVGDPGELKIVMNRITNGYMCSVVLARGSSFSDSMRREAEAGLLTSWGGYSITVYNGSYVDANGTITKYIADGKVFIAVGNDWGEMQVGTCLVPPDRDNGMPKKVQGRASWAEIKRNPVSISLFEEENFLPVIKKVENILVADVN